MDDNRRSALDAQRLFAAALREARLRYARETGQGEITQKAFAKMLGISGERPEERYRLYESAEREPPLWILAALRRVTGYSLDALVAQLPAGRPLEQPPPRPTKGGNPATNPDKEDCRTNVAMRRLRPVGDVERR